MSGQLIILPGVYSGAVSGAERIDVSLADVSALRIAGLKHVISAKSLKNISSGGVSGRCRKTGSLLTPTGTGAAGLTIATLNGHSALTLKSPNSWSASLALPPGSATTSYCAVFAATIGAISRSGANNSVLAGVYTSANVNSSIYARFRASGNYPETGMTASGSGVTATGIPFVLESLLPVSTWGIYVVDFDSLTNTARISYNSSNIASSAVLSANVVAADSAVHLGYPLSSSSFRDSGIGDFYLFDRSLLASTQTRLQLDSLIAGLKSQYGIA